MSGEQGARVGNLVFLQGKISFGEVDGFEGYAVSFDTSTLLHYLERAARNKGHRCKIGPVVVEVLRNPPPAKVAPASYESKPEKRP
jgi:hypothetical protein